MKETVYLHDIPMTLCGRLPEKGIKAPDFILTAQDLSDIQLKYFRGKRVVLNIFPSLDTEVCAASVRHFNEDAAKMNNTVVICASMDLPFAAGRFCSANGIKNVITGSAFRTDFGKLYGVTIEDGPMKGLLARAVVVIDENGKVKDSYLVRQITEEPDYAKVLMDLE